MDYLIFEVLTLCKINKNDQQIRAILKTLSVSQVDKIQKFVKSILSGKITLNDTLYRQLSKHKNFLRVICFKFNVNYILKNYDAFCEIMKIMLKTNNELCKKSSSDTLRGMEQFKRTEYKKQRSNNIEEKSGIKFKQYRKKGNIGEKNFSERKRRKEKNEYETSENEVESETEYEETGSESEINKIENSNEEEEEEE